MKKITFLLAAGLFGLCANAQDLSVQSVSTSTPGGNSTEAILFDQSTLGTSGIVSDYSNDDSAGVWSADDFVLASSNEIQTITVFGFNNNSNLPTDITGMSFYIYGNLAGFDIPDSNPTSPGDGLMEIVDLDPASPFLTIDDNGTGGYTFIVDVAGANGSPVILPAGTYWIVAAPSMDNIGGFDGASRWNWYDGTAPAAGSEAHLIDPTDVFGAGATDWTAFSALGLTFGSTAFIIEGEPALGLGDNALSQVSVYPNPTSDVLNIRVPSTVTVQNAVLYDVLGKDTGVRLVNGTMNTASLAAGVYVLNVNTSAGTLSEKVIKR
jgi:hypothetical protein